MCKLRRLYFDIFLCIEYFQCLQKQLEKKEAMNLKGSRKRCMGGFRGENRKGEMTQLYDNFIKKSKESSWEKCLMFSKCSKPQFVAGK